MNVILAIVHRVQQRRCICWSTWSASNWNWTIWIINSIAQLFAAVALAVELAAAAEWSDTLSRGGDNYNLRMAEWADEQKFSSRLVFAAATFCVSVEAAAAGFSSFDFLARRSFKRFLAARVVIFQWNETNPFVLLYVNEDCTEAEHIPLNFIYTLT